MGPIDVQDTGKYGRGVFATRDIQAGELLESAPVIVMEEREWKYVKKTALFDYCFIWGDDSEQTAIALGYGSLYNHSYRPNAIFRNNPNKLTIDFYAVQHIKKGDEITINYNEDLEDLTPLWFDVIE